MIGPRKLSLIREQLRDVLSDSANADPIRWLEQQASPRNGQQSREVLDSIERILKADLKPRKRKPARTAQ